MAPLAAAAPYIALASAGVQAIGVLQAGSAEKDASDVEALLAEAQGAQEETRTAEEEKLRRKDARKLLAKQRAGFAGAGVTSAGTPLLVMAETLLDAEEDVIAIQTGGKARASAFRNRAQTFRDLGKSRQRAGRFRAGSTLLSGLGNFST